MPKSLFAEDIEHVWQNIGSLWKELDGCSIFITGGTGFFGTWLLETLCYAIKKLSLNVRVSVLSRDPDAYLLRMPHIKQNNCIEWIKGDICNFLWPSGQYHFLIHAATDTVARSKDKDHSNESNGMINGTLNIINFAKSAGVKKMLFTSSGAVYGNQNLSEKELSESSEITLDPENSSSWYGFAKLECERHLAAFSDETGCAVSIARCFAFIGPHLPLNQQYAVGNFIRDGLSGGPIRINGDGRTLRSYLYAADLAIYLWTMLFKASNYRIYNVGSSNSVTISMIAEMIAAYFETTVMACIQNNVENYSIYVPDVNKAKQEMSLHQQICIADAIQRTCRWYK